MNGVGEKRKIRSDKKRDVKPTIPVKLKETVYRISYITNTPVKDVAEYICESGIASRKVVDHLSERFRRDFKFGQTLYMGDLNKPSLRNNWREGAKERITIRFNQATYERINALGYALDVTPTKATAILLDASIRDTAILNVYIKKYLKEHLDEGRMKELRKIMKFINQNNPYSDQVTWTALLSYIYEEIRTSTGNMINSVQDWIDQYK